MSDQKPARRFQFSLRLLLVAMLLIAAFFGGRASMYSKLRQTRDQLLRAEQQARLLAEEAAMQRDQALIGQLQAQQALADAQARLAASQAERVKP